MGENLSGKESSFNEALFKMQRLHGVQDEINLRRTNLLAYDLLKERYNYDVVISLLLSLLAEVKVKLSDKEKEEATKWRDAILDIIELKPVHEKSKTNGMEGIKDDVKVNVENWKKLRGAIFNLEDFVREMIEEHGLGSPNVEDEPGWD